MSTSLVERMEELKDMFAVDPTKDVDMETELRVQAEARIQGSLLMAIAYYNDKTMPHWLARAVCSPWGKDEIERTIARAKEICERLNGVPQPSTAPRKS